MERRPSGIALRRGRHGDDPRASPPPRCPGARRRRSRGRRGSGPARAADRGRRGVAVDGGCGRRQRAHRVRRIDRPAHRAARRGDELPRDPPALAVLRRRVPDPRGSAGADGDLAGGATHRGHHRVFRRAILRVGAAHEQEDAVTAVEVRSLSVELGGRSILDAVSLSVPSGGWLGLIGPNGAGKTTLLRAVAGLVPSRGD
ncbi:MAG: ABC transporter ATP-binding protein, partial [Actinobacteria bacterium]